MLFNVDSFPTLDLVPPISISAFGEIKFNT